MKKHPFLILLLLLVSFNSFSQSCNNEDFELTSSTFSIPSVIPVTVPMAVPGWTVNGGVNTGTVNSCNLNVCCPSNPNSLQLIGTTSTAGFNDPNIGSAYSIFSPLGNLSNPNSGLGYGNWFCKINDDIPNSSINKLSKLFFPVTPSNYLVRFAILPVIQNSSHSCCSAPIIKVIVRNASTNSVITSPQLTIGSNTTCSSSNCSGVLQSFSVCPSNPAFSYSKWGYYWFDLSPYIGLSIKLEVTVADCTAGDHAGYCYFDMNCVDLSPMVLCPTAVSYVYSSCGNSNIPAFAPIGFDSYLWNGPVGWPGNGATTQSVSLTLPGAYSLSCSVTGVCSSFPITFTVNNTPPASATLTSSQSTACAGGNTVALTGSPAGGTYTGSFVTGNNFNPTSAGNYSVAYTYTDSNGCSDTATSTINVITCATVINNLTTFSFNAELYPQPTKDLVNINLINSFNKNIEVKIIDITGKEIERKELEINQGKAQFSTLHLSNGIYILQLKNSQGQIAVKRLVISK
jgi:hypothetical protein